MTTTQKLAKCPQCRDDVLVGWEDCIHCGFVLPNPNVVVRADRVPWRIVAAGAGVAALAVGAVFVAGDRDDRSVLEYCVDRYAEVAEDTPAMQGVEDVEAACEEVIEESGETRAAVDLTLKMAESFADSLDD